MNVNLLKAQIVLKGKKMSDIAEKLKISKSALYRKLKGTSDFTRREIFELMNYLEIDAIKAIEIFFGEKVS